MILSYLGNIVRYFSQTNKGLVTNYGEGGAYKTGMGVCKVLPL